MTRRPRHPDRRRTPRGGRRKTDWQGATSSTCHACRHLDAIDVSSGTRLIWLRCAQCGEVWVKVSDGATNDPAGTKDELQEKLREWEETCERLEDENETLREASKTFGDLADRLAQRLAEKRAHDGSTDS